MLGTTDPASAKAVVSSHYASLVAEVSAHPSYAAQGYYLPFYQQYFESMYASLKEIDRVSRAGAPIVLVVQDSWFKDVHVPTPTILSEMARSLGWEVVGEHHFGVRSRASIHPHRTMRTSSSATETVSVFSK